MCVGVGWRVTEEGNPQKKHTHRPAPTDNPDRPMKMSTILALLYAASAHGFFYLPMSASRYVDNAYNDMRRVMQLVENAQEHLLFGDVVSSWNSMDKDMDSSSYQMRMRMPEIESSSISASLAQDGRTLLVSGKRKMDGCTCSPSTVREVLLPYRPRSEDIGLQLDAQKNELTITLARDSGGHTAVPIAVNVKDPITEEVVADKVPKEMSLADKEKTLTEKFRAAGAAATLATKVDSGDEAVKEEPNA